jgi:hypothetical protein
MTVRTAQVAIALAMAVATSHQSLAEPACTGGAGCFKKDFVPSRIPRGAAIVRFSLLECAAKFLISWESSFW